MDQAYRIASNRMAGRKVIVTGAASGIGKAVAELFHAEGASLALMDQNEQGLRDIAGKLDAAPIIVDLADADRLADAVREAGDAMGGIDGVVNCAAYSRGGPVTEISDEIFARAVSVNLMAPFVICRSALPYLRAAPRATIVNIASGQGLLPNAPNNSAYSATKGGLIALSKALACELAPHIRVNALAPGLTNTPMAQHLFADYADPNDAPFVQQYAMRRIAEPREIANGVLFLSCEESSFVTGIVMAVDGGRTYH